MSYRLPNGDIVEGREDRLSSDEIYELNCGSALMPYRCMECKLIYKYVPTIRSLEVGEVSSGYCPTCVPIVEARWFGNKI